VKDIQWKVPSDDFSHFLTYKCKYMTKMTFDQIKLGIMKKLELVKVPFDAPKLELPCFSLFSLEISKV